MQKYKVGGWRSRFLLKNMTAISDILTRIFLVLRFDKEDFEEIPEFYFYNRGATYETQYLNLYWNDPQREIHPGRHVRCQCNSQEDVPNWWAIQQQTNRGFLRRFANITTELEVHSNWYRSWWQRGNCSTFKNRKQAKTDTTAQSRRLITSLSKSGYIKLNRRRFTSEITQRQQAKGSLDLRPEGVMRGI